MGPSALPTSLLDRFVPSEAEAVTADGRPDIAGRWLSCGLEGEVDEFLAALDVGWLARRSAEAMGYGIGEIRLAIRQAGDDVEVDVLGVPNELTVTFHVGKGQEPVPGPGGLSLQVSSAWQECRALGISVASDDGAGWPSFLLYRTRGNGQLALLMSLQSGKLWVIAKLQREA